MEDFLKCLPISLPLFASVSVSMTPLAFTSCFLVASRSGRDEWLMTSPFSGFFLGAHRVSHILRLLDSQEDVGAFQNFSLPPCYLAELSSLSNPIAITPWEYPFAMEPVWTKVCLCSRVLFIELKKQSDFYVVCSSAGFWLLSFWAGEGRELEIAPR